MQVKETAVPTKQEQVNHVAAAQSELSTNEKLKEKVHLAGTGQQEIPKQLKNADVAVHNSKQWCGTCNMWFPDEVVMAAHLKGREHLAKLQIPMSSTALAERYLEENGSDAQEKLITHKSKDYSLNHHAEWIKATDTCDKSRMLIPSQIVYKEGDPVCEDIKATEQMTKHGAAEPKKLVYLNLKISLVTFMEDCMFTSIALDELVQQTMDENIKQAVNCDR